MKNKHVAMVACGGAFAIALGKTKQVPSSKPKMKQVKESVLVQDYQENSYDMPGAKVSTNTVEVHSLPQGPKYLHESSLELSQSKTKLPGYVSATSFQAPKSPSQAHPSRKRSAKNSRAVSPELAAPQNNLSLMNAFLKKKPKLTKRSKSRDDSKERKKKKR